MHFSMHSYDEPCREAGVPDGLLCWRAAMSLSVRQYSRSRSVVRSWLPSTSHSCCMRPGLPGHDTAMLSSTSPIVACDAQGSLGNQPTMAAEPRPGKLPALEGVLSNLICLGPYLDP